MLNIIQAETQAHFQQIRELMTEFMKWDLEQTKQLGLDPVKLANFYYATRDDSLPGRYAPPKGCLLLAAESDHAAGMVAFKPVSSNTCELTRMYVRPEFRGKGLARKLIQMLITKARESGYNIIRLETATFMQPAIALYSSLGFIVRPPYYEVPEDFLDHTVFMEVDISS
ncbi:MAG: GNAT family N-acetyltransferase [Chloroflexi bacterium]|nr:GNAT family N-acetyltransferase [Chloroflexota bacterium]